MNIEQMSVNLQKAGKAMETGIKLALYKESTSLLNQIKEHAPVSTGYYRNNWKVSRGRVSIGGSFASLTYSNSTSYAEYMEYGADKGAYPWFFPNKKKASGRLTVRNGRVWAGGLNPGHEKTVGGAYNQVFTEQKLDYLCNKIADGALRGF